MFKAHLQLNLDWKSVFKKNIQVYIFQIQSGCDLNFIYIRVLQEDYKGKLLGKQVQNQLEKSLQLAISLKIKKCQDAKSYTKKTTSEQHTVEQVLPEEETCFEQESDVDQEVIISSPQTATSAFIPYIKGPKMDWTVNDSLYNRFIKWKIKCENILECELALLSESRKCKKVVAWTKDFGIDQYVSWDLSPEEVCLEEIWKRFEEFCKPQTNEIRARFDLLTSFRQGGHSVDEWYNAVQNQINLARYPQETARILQRDISCCFF